MLKNIVVGTVLGFVVVFLAIQLVPYGRDHTNPPVQQEPTWTDPQTRALVQRACFDCHSNQTVWPWYSNIAPVSWLVQRDVDQGRRRLNFSEWNLPQRGGREAARVLQRGEMPQWFYVVMHPSAQLSAADRQALIQGLGTSLALHQAHLPQGSPDAQIE